MSVSDDEVSARLGAGSSSQTEQEGNADFLASQAGAQLLYEKLFTRVTNGVRKSARDVRQYYEAHKAQYGSQRYDEVREGIQNQLVGAQRNAAWKRWLAETTRELPVRKS